MNTIPRRSLLRRAFGLAAGTALAPTLVPFARAADSCTDPSSESLRESISYTSVAPDPESSCASCAFFTPDAATAGCGYCEILSGPADAGGHCESWSPRGA